MIEKWREAPLGDVADLKHVTTKITKSSYVSEGYVAFSASGPDGYLPYFDYDQTGVVLTAVGSCGKTWLAKGKWSCISNTIRFFSKVPDVDTEFLYWATRSREFWPQRGSVQPFISQGDARACIVRFPNIHEQRGIAATLGALDNKIDLNRRMNETLEALSRVLFKDWFVDFGPTRAAMEGIAPYLAQDIWDLFPDKLDDEGKPDGWESKPLDEIAKFLNGAALQKFPASDPKESLPVIKIAELRGGITTKSNQASREVPDKYVVKDGDFLFSWSASLLAKFWTGGEGALNQHLFKVTSDRYPAWFFSEWVQHHLETFQMIAASKATTMGHIQRRHLKEAMTTCPPDRVIARMGGVIAPLIEHFIHNELESRTLALTRDLLLPKLMSGEIRVADADELAVVAT